MTLSGVAFNSEFSLLLMEHYFTYPQSLPCTSLDGEMKDAESVLQGS